MTNEELLKSKMNEAYRKAYGWTESHRPGQPDYWETYDQLWSNFHHAQEQWAEELERMEMESSTRGR